MMIANAIVAVAGSHLNGIIVPVEFGNIPAFSRKVGKPAFILTFLNWHGSSGVLSECILPTPIV